MVVFFLFTVGFLKHHVYCLYDDFGQKNIERPQVLRCCFKMDLKITSKSRLLGFVVQQPSSLGDFDKNWKVWGRTCGGKRFFGAFRCLAYTFF